MFQRHSYEMDPQTTDTFPTMILFHTFTADMGACSLGAQIGPAAEFPST